MSRESTCPYIDGNRSRNFHFYARWVEGAEFDELLKAGWRRFAQYYFKPNCQMCTSCVPIRIPVNEVKFSKSKRRILNKNFDIQVKFSEKRYHKKIFELYQNHSSRFYQESTENEFLEAHYTDTCKSFQSEYYLGDELVAVGFLDQSDHALSSSYFFYNTSYMNRSLGFLSIMKEIEHTRFLNLDYYYLGYYIKENHFMNYKNAFYPHELLDWGTGNWLKIESKK